MIDAQSWRKTNYIEPHEYFLKPQNPELFAEIARRVKEKPTKKSFSESTIDITSSTDGDIGTIRLY